MQKITEENRLPNPDGRYTPTGAETEARCAEARGDWDAAVAWWQKAQAITIGHERTARYAAAERAARRRLTGH